MNAPPPELLLEELELLLELLDELELDPPELPEELELLLEELELLELLLLDDEELELLLEELELELDELDAPAKVVARTEAAADTLPAASRARTEKL